MNRDEIRYVLDSTQFGLWLLAFCFAINASDHAFDLVEDGGWGHLLLLLLALGATCAAVVLALQFRRVRRVLERSVR